MKRFVVMVALCLGMGSIALSDDPQVIDPNFPNNPAVIPSTASVSILPANFNWLMLIPTTIEELTDAMLVPGAFAIQNGSTYISVVRYDGVAVVNGVSTASFSDPGFPPGWFYVRTRVWVQGELAPFFAALQQGDMLVIVYRLVTQIGDVDIYGMALYNPPPINP